MNKLKDKSQTTGQSSTYVRHRNPRLYTCNLIRLQAENSFPISNRPPLTIDMYHLGIYIEDELGDTRALITKIYLHSK